MPKRGNGTGSIQQRGSRFIAVLSLPPDQHGKRPRITARFNTRGEAEDWLQIKIAPPEQPLTEGIHEMAATMTYHSFLQQWLELRKPHVREKTWLEYQRLIRKYLESASIAEIPVHLLTPLHIERLVLQWLTEGANKTQAFMALRLVKLTLGQAVDWGLRPYNPATRVKAPRYPRYEMKVWTAHQARDFLAHCLKNKPRWYALFYLAITTGMRRGELLGLRWQDISLEDAALTIRQSLVQSGSKAVLNEPKTPASRRCILLSPDTVQVLKEHRVRQDTEQARWKDRSPLEVDLVFPSTVGRFQLPSILVKIFHHLIQQAGLPDLRLHDLRHTAASLLVRQGVPIKAVAERLGHQDASLTMRVYTHFYDDQRRAAALPLDVLLSQ